MKNLPRRGHDEQVALHRRSSPGSDRRLSRSAERRFSSHRSRSARSAAGAVALELLGFYKQLGRLATRSARPTPDTARVLVSSGSGKSFGAQLLLRQTLRAGWSGWLSATLPRSERKGDDGIERLFDHDQPLLAIGVRLER